MGVSTTSPDDSAPADTRRDELLRIAGDVFARTGYSRTALRDIADAAGILTGSLYHHFPSKESLAVELISAFHKEIDALAHRPGLRADTPLERIPEFADKVGRVAERHRAAIYMSAYDPPSTAGERLSDLISRQPEMLDGRWARLLEDAAAAGQLRANADLEALRSVLGSTMFDLAADPDVRAPRELVGVVTTLLLHGIAVDEPDPDALAESVPASTARAVLQSWAQGAEQGRRAEILAVAREEFGRRGYEATTIRDIARIADIRPSSLYRHFASKQELLDAIIGEFSQRLLAGYETVAAAPGSAAERLDALAALMASAAGLFWAEFVIVKDWWRNLGPTTAGSPPPDNAARLRMLEQVLEEGIKAGEFVPPDDLPRLSVALRSTFWVPLGEPGEQAAARRHRLLSSSILRGAAVRRE